MQFLLQKYESLVILQFNLYESMKIIIIGAGPGGYETAVEAAKRGAEVVLTYEKKYYRPMVC